MKGSGTSSDPWQISSKSDLQLLSGNGYASYEGTGKYFILTKDIDFNSDTFTPIGNNDHKFNGNLDGNNRTIKNMIISDSADGTGLISVASESHISNLKFDSCSVDITSTSAYNVGILAGVDEKSTITNIETSGCSITGTGINIVGGIAGKCTSTNIKQCYVHDGCISVSSTEPTTGSYRFGGIVGEMINLTPSSEDEFSEPVYYARYLRAERMYINGFTECGGIFGRVYPTPVSKSSHVYTSYIKDCKVSSCVIKCSNKDPEYVASGCGGIAGSIFMETYAYAEISTCTVDNTYLNNDNYVGGILGRGDLSEGYKDIFVRGSVVSNCTMCGTNNCAGVVGMSHDEGVIRLLNHVYVKVIGCTVKHCNIDGGGSSSCSGMVGYGEKWNVSIDDECIQDYNNLVGTGPFNADNPTNQTSIPNQYITAEYLSADVSNAKVVYDVYGQRGAGVSYDDSTHMITGGTVWDYKGNGTKVTKYSNEHIFNSAGAYTTILTLSNPGNTTGVSLNTGVTVTASDLSITAKPEVVQKMDDESITTALKIVARAYVKGANTCQWYYSLNPNESWIVITGATQLVSTLDMSTFKDHLDYHFKCIATDINGNTIDTDTEGYRWIEIVKNYGDKALVNSIHDITLRDKSAKNCHNMYYISNHDMSILEG